MPVLGRIFWLHLVRFSEKNCLHITSQFVFGRGTQEQHAKQRRKTILGPQKRQLEPILDFLPILLQFSLLYFAISLMTNIWTLNITLGYIQLVISSIGVLVYAPKSIIAIIYEDSPFQSRVSILFHKSYRSLHQRFRSLRHDHKDQADRYHDPMS